MIFIFYVKTLDSNPKNKKNIKFNLKRNYSIICKKKKLRE